MRSNRKRTYDSGSRQVRAAQSRERILDEARRLLLANGYAATTIAAIARAARVSVETIYKTFGGKPGLVRAIRDRALAGTAAQHAETRSDRMQQAAAGPREVIAGWAALAQEVSPLVSPILLLVREAVAHDAEMATLQTELDDARLARMAVNARTLKRHGISATHARDVLWLYSSPELYELLVLRRGWSVRKYGRFIADALTAALL